MVEKIIEDFMTIYESSWSFSISLSDFYKKGSQLNYNSIIRKNIPKDTQLLNNLKDFYSTIGVSF
ncbi:hypothetical protein N9546_05125 [Flavobacteriaceae bacterium]|jgi:IS30 family transposase|nr:hypothetical protein [Flavobacteriaceae bacterium]